MLRTFGPGKRVVANATVENVIDLCGHYVVFFVSSRPIW